MLEALVPVGISALIFGGCCTNVYALESILKYNPDSGLLITLTQFLLVTLTAYPSQRPSPHGKALLLRKPAIPPRKLFASAAMFFAVNMLNNWAFAFDISVPVHIILRSFGSVTTMAAGRLRGRRYSRVQVLSVLILTAGVLVSAWADAVAKGKSMALHFNAAHTPRSTIGLAVLLAAQILSAYMGVYVQDMYAAHGTHWAENLFYTHLFSLPLFLPLAPTLQAQYARLASSPPLTLPPGSGLRALTAKAHIPSALVYLLVNAATQLLCITGVNLLGAKSSAVTVTIVLNVRKLVSFMLSVWLFGNELSGLMMLGAALVFGSGALYGWETSWRLRRKSTTSAEKNVAKPEDDVAYKKAQNGAVRGRRLNGSMRREWNEL